jgi:hypothetical protein
MTLQMFLDQGAQQGVLVRAQGTLLLQEFSQWRLLSQYPGVHDSNELVAGDEVHLQGQDAEEQVAVSADSRHRRAPE